MLQYRTEHTLYDSDKDPLKVMMFETIDLGNDDIIITLRDKYCVHQPELFQTANELLNQNDDPDECKLKQFFQDVLTIIQKTLNKNIQYCLWLADKSTIIDQYSKWYETTTIDEYNVTNAIILSDLGYDGRLYGFEQMPKPIQTLIL